uniref:Uncharacterized protein n=1 Tax=Syphacia muris TaxID=451379 RepID=A0A0N5AXJ0_9BILA
MLVRQVEEPEKRVKKVVIKGGKSGGAKQFHMSQRISPIRWRSRNKELREKEIYWRWKQKALKTLEGLEQYDDQWIHEMSPIPDELLEEERNTYDAMEQSMIERQSSTMQHRTNSSNNSLSYAFVVTSGQLHCVLEVGEYKFRNMVI